MSNNQIITDEWVYFYNIAHNQMFAAGSDKKDDDHIVETGAGGRTSEKYHWKIHEHNGNYFIENRYRGFMFAAVGDKEGLDHLVECRPSITTLERAIEVNEKSNKWSWNITATDKGLRIINNLYGQMFAADTDKSGDDHFVETRPGTIEESIPKYIWRIEKT